MPTLNWIGKDKVVNHHQEVPYKVLEHKFGVREGIETTEETNSGNLIIHGDNLEALKSLLPKYQGKVDCVYIDPPYNTGNENWIYNDNVNDPKIQKWLGEVVGQQGEDLTRHDKWLCMMYPRLRILHQLLSETGVIFVSINFAHEESHLRLLLDEIFSPSNYIGTLTWESTTQPANAGKARFKLQQKVEPILFYCKDKHSLPQFILQEVDSGLKYPHMGKYGACRFEIIEKSDAGGYKRDTMKFPILGQLPRDGKRWQIGWDTAQDLINRGRIEIIDGIVKKAVYPEDEEDKRKFQPFWSHLSSKEVGTAQSGKDLLNEIMERAVGFDTVKPPQLIEELLSHFDSNAIILDSFAGSGTTAHAVLNLNKDGGNRKFILIEMEDYANTITAERVRKIIKGYGQGDKYVKGIGGSFDYYELGNRLFLEDGNLNEDIDEAKIREYIFFSETNSPTIVERTEDNKYFLGEVFNTSYYFYYEKGVKTTLTHETLRQIVKKKAEQYVIYADTCTLTEDEMSNLNVIFKKIPRDIKRF